MPAHLTEGQKRMLISNGTYNADGTVNMETAHRRDGKSEEQRRQPPEPGHVRSQPRTAPLPFRRGWP